MQESLGRHVALKLLTADALVDPLRLERFRREAKSAAQLHHTNIVPVFGVGEADGRHFYAMQFIAGHPLDMVIEEVRRLKERDEGQAMRPHIRPATLPNPRVPAVPRHQGAIGRMRASRSNPNHLATHRLRRSTCFIRRVAPDPCSACPFSLEVSD